ncbi:MAG TPA: D-tyrosyl-tRNA(Tyr) deacylase [Chromatiales bacterium]|nr:D-tyrosyl-tRNA(Tyr) deacylase [Chromatiales bacterium]
MIALLQRVSRASVSVGGSVIAEIGEGLLVFVAVERGDMEREAGRMLERILNYRVFADEAGKMNLSLQDRRGGLLLVPQFTLAADTRKGTRPSFTPAAGPAQGQQLFDYLVRAAEQRHRPVQSGAFGADMRVALVNEGPVTFSLRVAPEDTGNRKAP